MAKARTAQMVAVSVVVLCPHCGAEQPAPDNGSDMWLPHQIRALTGEKKPCSACDEPITFSVQTRLNLGE
jgi:hypothetical protein